MLRRLGRRAAVKTEVDGRVFHSKGEAARYLELKLCQDAGYITSLRCQVPFEIKINGVLICRYVADFVYYDRALLMDVIEDSKGFQESVFKLKWKMMQACHPDYSYLLTHPYKKKTKTRNGLRRSRPAK